MSNSWEQLNKQYRL